MELVHSAKPHFRPEEQRVVRKAIRRVIIGYIALMITMFIVAGRIDWWQGWLVMPLLFVLTAMAFQYLKRVNPEVIVARSQSHTGSEGWDQVWLAIFVPTVLAIFLAAPLDTERLKLWPLSVTWFWLGLIGMIPGMLLTIWAEVVNPFFEPTVRIQTDRKQYVIRTGPYAYIRHPGYLALLLFLPSLALMLGSGLALWFALACDFLVAIRTALEDRTLQKKLPGYLEYSREVRYRLIPGIW